jgi:hypothetical protein
MTITGYDKDFIVGEYYRCIIAEENSPSVITNYVTLIEEEDPYVARFFLTAGTGAGVTGFGYFDEASGDFLDAGQISENPAFSSNVEGLNHEDVSLNNGVIYYLYYDSQTSTFRLALDGLSSGGAVPDANLILIFTKNVNNDGTGGTDGGSLTTGVPGSQNRATTYSISQGGGVSWTWHSVPSEVVSTFSSINNNPIKVLIGTEENN